MGAMKDYLMKVADEMNIGDTLSPRVVREASRRINRTTTCCVCGGRIDPVRDEHVYCHVEDWQGVPLRKTWCVDCEAIRRSDVDAYLSQFETDDVIEMHMAPGSCVSSIRM